MTMEIRVLGSGCARCATLAENAREAVRASGVDATVEERHDPMEIVRMGILATPALLIDGELVLAGHVATVPQLEEMFTGRLVTALG
jgi:small redox-active disulfide protein 2